MPLPPLHKRISLSQKKAPTPHNIYDSLTKAKKTSDLQTIINGKSILEWAQCYSVQNTGNYGNYAQNITAWLEEHSSPSSKSNSTTAPLSATQRAVLNPYTVLPPILNPNPHHPHPHIDFLDPATILYELPPTPCSDSDHPMPGSKIITSVRETLQTPFLNKTTGIQIIMTTREATFGGAHTFILAVIDNRCNPKTGKIEEPKVIGTGILKVTVDKKGNLQPYDLAIEYTNKAPTYESQGTDLRTLFEQATAKRPPVKAL
jgi:hypothetical protein